MILIADTIPGLCLLGFQTFEISLFPKLYLG